LGCISLVTLGASDKHRNTVAAADRFVRCRRCKLTSAAKSPTRYEIGYRRKPQRNAGNLVEDLPCRMSDLFRFAARAKKQSLQEMKGFARHCPRHAS